MEPDTHLAAQKMVVVFLVKEDGRDDSCIGKECHLFPGSPCEDGSDRSSHMIGPAGDCRSPLTPEKAGKLLRFPVRPESQPYLCAGLLGC